MAGWTQHRREGALQAQWANAFLFSKSWSATLLVCLTAPASTSDPIRSISKHGSGAVMRSLLNGTQQLHVVAHVTVARSLCLHVLAPHRRMMRSRESLGPQASAAFPPQYQQFGCLGCRGNGCQKHCARSTCPKHSRFCSCFQRCKGMRQWGMGWD